MIIEDLKLWSTENELVEAMYQREGIMVRDYCNSDICYIFFSSNDLFYPNTIAEFKKKIVEENRFEWTKMAMSKNITEVSGRHIFVRDIYKMWYVTGCDAKHSNLDSLIDYLGELSKGYKVITVGSSAGGFMAMLAAIKLDAVCCFDFSGQVSLKYVRQDFYRDRLNEDINNSPYYELVPLLDSTNCIFYYFYPEYNLGDKNVYMELRSKCNVRGFSFGQVNHAATMLTSNIRYVIARDTNYLERLYNIYNGKVINIIEFFIRTVPMYMWGPLIFREGRGYINRKLGKNDK